MAMVIETDPTARIKLLATIAQAEAEDSRSDPDNVKPHLGKISTEDLRKIFPTTRYCIIQMHIAKEINRRKDVTTEQFFQLTTITEHAAVRKILGEAMMTLALKEDGFPPTDIIHVAHMLGGLTSRIKPALICSLETIPKGKLPELYSQITRGIEDLIIDEFKHRNDPIEEGLLALLKMNPSDDARRAIADMAKRDRRVTSAYIISLTHDDVTTRSLLYEKIKGEPIEYKASAYMIANEALQGVILQTTGNDVEALPYVDLLMEHAKTQEARAMVIRMLGACIPLEKLIELRARTTDKDTLDAFNGIFGARYRELQKFLDSQ